MVKIVDIYVLHNSCLTRRFTLFLWIHFKLIYATESFISVLVQNTMLREHSAKFGDLNPNKIHDSRFNRIGFHTLFACFSISFSKIARATVMKKSPFFTIVEYNTYFYCIYIQNVPTKMHIGGVINCNNNNPDLKMYVWS